MKIKSMLTILVLAITVMTLSHCDSDDAPQKTEEQIYLERLSRTWAVDNVTLDALDVTDFFATLKLTVKGDRTYTVSNPVPDIWPASGAFTLEKISTSEHYRIVRNDDTVITITGLSNNELSFTFQYNSPGGRTKGVSGVYSFSMVLAN